MRMRRPLATALPAYVLACLHEAILAVGEKAGVPAFWGKTSESGVKALGIPGKPGPGESEPEEGRNFWGNVQGRANVHFIYPEGLLSSILFIQSLDSRG